MERFDVIICLFNKRLFESQTLVSILELDILGVGFNLHLWDNSSAKMDENEQYLLEEKGTSLSYDHTPENKPLSFVYNRILSRLENVSTNIILLDDDTRIPSNYIQTVSKLLKTEKDIKLFIPTIRHKELIVSPAIDFYLFSTYFKSQPFGKIGLKNLTAINSGMVIRSIYFNSFRYNEQLNFYGTDNNFMLEYMKREKLVMMIPICLDHHLSIFDASKEKKIKIHSETIRARKIIYSNSTLIIRILVFLNIKLTSLKKCLQYKTLEYIK